ncbi:MAG: hypothetical protein FWG63_02240 [Defluviitaleaceae bacterium]|nr:hypothetical protein [Defluviitaleaceae bacterium]
MKLSTEYKLLCLLCVLIIALVAIVLIFAYFLKTHETRQEHMTRRVYYQSQADIERYYNQAQIDIVRAENLEPLYILALEIVERKSRARGENAMRWNSRLSQVLEMLETHQYDVE